MSGVEEEMNPGFGLIDEPHSDEPAENVGAPSTPTPTRRMATKQELLDLSKFIGGFEKWPEMDADCRRHCVSFLELADRCRLAVCSKSDFKVVSTTPMYVHSISIVDTETSHPQFEREDFQNVQVRVQFASDYNADQNVELVFSQLGEHTQIRWLAYNPRHRRLQPERFLRENCDYYKEAVKFAEQLMKKSRFGVRGLTVEMRRYPIGSSLIRRLDRCTSLRLGCSANDVAAIKWWLERVPERLTELNLAPPYEQRDFFSIPAEILDLPQVKNVENSLWVYGRADFTDQQFLTLRAKQIHFYAIHITDDGINTFLRKWAAGNYGEGFKKVLLWSERQVNIARLIYGLDVRPWDDEFRQESDGFCGDFDRVCGSGTCFQVQHRHKRFDSLTLCIRPDCVSIFATGTEMTWQGRTFTIYSFPM